MLPNITALLPSKPALITLHGLSALVLLIPSFLLRKHTSQKLLRSVLWINMGIQVLLCFIAIFAGANLFGAIYPLALRALTLIGTLWIALYLFMPDKKPEKQVVQAGSMLIALMALFCFVPWLPHFTQKSFNLTHFDPLWAWAAVFIFAAILLAVWLRAPKALDRDKLIVFAPFGLAWLAQALSLRLSTTPWALLTLTLLGYLLFSWVASHEAAPVIRIAEQESDSTANAAQLLQADLQPLANPAEAQRSLAKSMAEFLSADICGLIEAKPNSSTLRCHQPYDLIREEHLSSFDLDFREAPALFKALESGSPLVSNTQLDSVRERKAIQDTMAFNRLGNFLFYPLALKDRQAALLCLSPYTEREFSSQDLDNLNGIRNKIETMLLRSANLADAKLREQNAQKEAECYQRDNVELGLNIAAEETTLVDLTHALDRLRLMDRSNPDHWESQHKVLESQMEKLFASIQEHEIMVAHANIDSGQKSVYEMSIRRNARHLRSLQQALQRMQNAHEELAEKAEPEEHLQMEEESEPISPQGLIFEPWREKFAQKQVQINEEIDPELTPAVLEKPLLRSVFDQLMRNALAASPVQGTTQVKIFENQLPERPRMVAIQVTDEGGGLSSWEQEHFLKFSQASGYPSPVGIGDSHALRHAIQTARDMGGGWDIHSDPGKTTTYRLSLPLEQLSC